MRQSDRRAVVVPICLLGSLLGGCGEANVGPRGSISGKVTYEGKPVAVGYLNFLPADGNGPTQATEIVDGEYTASGVTVGKKKLVVQTGSSGTKQVPDTTAPTPVVKKSGDEVPSDAVGNNQEVDIKEGSQTVDLTLQRPAGPSGKP